jgi:hypothetical protein
MDGLRVELPDGSAVQEAPGGKQKKKGGVSAAPEITGASAYFE